VEVEEMETMRGEVGEEISLRLEEEEVIDHLSEVEEEATCLRLEAEVEI
jgi:hypothetical protein